MTIKSRLLILKLSLINNCLQYFSFNKLSKNVFRVIPLIYNNTFYNSEISFKIVCNSTPCFKTHN